MFSDLANLRNVTIGENVTSIGIWAFSGCTSLTEITIPKKVTSIENLAFYGCSNLTKVYSKASTPPLSSGAFDVWKTAIYLGVPVGSKAAYQRAEGWKNFQTIEEVNF